MEVSEDREMIIWIYEGITGAQRKKMMSVEYSFEKNNWKAGNQKASKRDNRIKEIAKKFHRIWKIQLNNKIDIMNLKDCKYKNTCSITYFMTICSFIGVTLHRFFILF